tara:strand:+ start:4239 stop:5765 length:1527 start_codon:yes stop_codon:yes gene_type:complete
MALRDLQSDLTNLDFGKGTAFDRPNQGFSNQPFVKRTINYDNSIDSLTDGLVRGGILTATERSLQDVKRITKFFLTSQGLGFLTKQTGLQLSNPIIRTKAKAVGEEGDNIIDRIGDFVSNIEGSKSDQRLYNLGANTLASIAGSAAGIRFKREGITPLSDPEKFEGYVNDIELTQENSSNNRLIGLLNDHIINIDSENILFEYNGGPDSVYGLGQTTINKYVNTSIQSQLQIPSSPDGVTDSQLEELDALANRTDPGLMGDSAEGVVSEEDQVLNPLDKLSKLLPPRGIGGKDRTKRLHKSISEYHVSYNGKSDAVNLKEIQKDQSAYNENDDFIPFRFEAVNTDNPLKSDYVIFRAFLDGFNDNYNANHNSFNYNGRGETFYTYNGFTRNIDFSFKIAAQSKVEILPLYTKLNYLVSNAAPEYSDVGRMRTPFIKLTVGDWCNRVPGVLNTIALSWQKDYPWQIKNNENILMLPHVLDVNVQFTPIHNFLPEKSINSQFFNLTGANA